jgi:hypothetical protein
MRYRGMSFDEASKLLKEKRPLSALQSRHRNVLESWLQQYRYEETQVGEQTAAS